MALDTKELMERAIEARKEKNLTEAKRCWNEAVALCRRSGEKRALIRSLKGLAQIESDLEHEDDALPLYEEAVALCRVEDDPLMLAHTVRHLGDIHRRARRWALAEPCYTEALTLYRGNDETAPLDLANALRGMAILKESTGAIVEAKALWEEAGRLYESVHVIEGVEESAKRVAKLSKAD
jgi:tetratricopeptide (TPR) repeat protein